MTDRPAAASGPGPRTDADLRRDARQGDAEADGTGGADEAPHRNRAWKRRRNAVRWFSVVTVLALGGLTFLGYQGYDAAKNVTGGATATVITDPTAPGFVAAVDPTPVHLLALTTTDDALSALIVLVPDPSGSGGSILWSLGELVVEIDGKETALTDIYSSQGLEAVRSEFGKVAGFGMTDATIVGPADLEAIAEPLGTITVSNPDPISTEVKGKRVVKFAAGTLELEPDQLGEFLTTRAAGEAPENRSTRTGVLLSALSERLAAEGAVGAAATAPDGIDLGAELAAMGTVPADFVVLPFERTEFKSSYLYSPDAEQIATRLAGFVHFPVSAFPGQRPRVRLLNGTADTSAANTLAPQAAVAGGEVLLVGNANSLDVTETSVVYSDDSFREVAERIAELVGTSARQTDELSDTADIDVVLGADYAP